MPSEDLNPLQREINLMWENIGRSIENEFFLYGETQGAVRNCRDNLRLVLEERFGPLPSDVVRELEETDSLSRLKWGFDWALRIRTPGQLGLLPPEWMEPLHRGRTRGTWSNCQEDLLNLLRERFRKIPKVLEEQIRATDDIARLQSCMRRAVHIKTLGALQL